MLLAASFFRKHQQALLVVGLPLAMSLFVACLVYIPALFQRPSYDFIYSACSTSYCYNSDFFLDPQSSRIQQSTSSDAYYTSDSGVYTLYYYSITDHTSRKIDLNETYKYTLRGGVHSPDGFRLARDTNSSAIFGSYEQTSKYALYKGAAHHKTDIEHANYPEPQVIGWVIR